MACLPQTTIVIVTTEAARIGPHPTFRLIILQGTITRTIVVSEITTREVATPTIYIDPLHLHPDRDMSAEALLGI